MLWNEQNMWPRCEGGAADWRREEHESDRCWNDSFILLSSYFILQKKVYYSSNDKLIV